MKVLSLGKNSFTFWVSSILGVLLALILIPMVWPLFGWEATRSQSFIVTIVFVAYSSARSFLVRAIVDRFWPD